jgi:hypothetical protein
MAYYIGCLIKKLCYNYHDYIFYNLHLSVILLLCVVCALCVLTCFLVVIL